MHGNDPRFRLGMIARWGWICGLMLCAQAGEQLVNLGFPTERLVFQRGWDDAAAVPMRGKGPPGAREEGKRGG